MLSLSTTAILDASSCLKRYQYHWVERLVPKPALVRHPLRRGSDSRLLAALPRRRRAWLDVLDALVAWAFAQGVDGEEINALKAEVEQVDGGLHPALV